jgi:hypothetical protein
MVGEAGPVSWKGIHEAIGDKMLERRDWRGTSCAGI